MCECIRRRIRGTAPGGGTPARDGMVSTRTKTITGKTDLGGLESCNPGPLRGGLDLFRTAAAIGNDMNWKGLNWLKDPGKWSR